jgi:hypothetical protein
METGFCALLMREGFMPGSAHITKLDPACEGLNILRATVPQAPKVVLKNSSGFGGANVALLMRRLMGIPAIRARGDVWGFEPFAFAPPRTAAAASAPAPRPEPHHSAACPRSES